VDDSQEPSQRPSQSYLFEKCDAAAGIARNGRCVPQDEPPAVVAPSFADAGEQSNSCILGERKKGQLVPTIQSRDDTRREPAEPSGARVEQRRAWKPNTVRNAGH
jgi:hypothetical protein